MYGTEPNSLVQFDYLDLGTSYTGDKYVLMISDDHSGYSWLYPTPDTSADQAAHALLDWCSAFGAPLSFMSESPTHFKNETLALLAKGLRSKYHFTAHTAPGAIGQ